MNENPALLLSVVGIIIYSRGAQSLSDHCPSANITMGSILEQQYLSGFILNIVCIYASQIYYRQRRIESNYIVRSAAADIKTENSTNCNDPGILQQSV
jgi:hypothetical protein